MTRRIPLESLVPGMYVRSFDLSWFKHPFVTSRLGLIHSKALIEHLRGLGVHFVEIDPEKGLDLAREETPTRAQSPSVPEAEPAPPPEPEPAPRPAPEPVRPAIKILPDPVSPPPPGSPETARFAQKLFIHAIDQTKRLLADVSHDRQLDSVQVRGLVGQLMTTVEHNEDVVQYLMRLKAYDEYTYTHGISLSALSLLLGKHLGLSAEERELMGLAGLVHDVGKCMLPLEILNKPGKLTAEEFATIKSHPLMGYEYIKRQGGIVADACRAALEHHERLDGTGYPNGLSGAQIQPMSSMLAIVDVYDALTSNRCYHTGMSPHAALKLLYQDRDKHFPADILERFIKCMGVYPAWSSVQLKNGLYGVVTPRKPDNPLFPEVLLLTDQHHHPVTRIKVNTWQACKLLGQPEYEIMRHVEPEEMNAPPTP